MNLLQRINKRPFPHWGEKHEIGISNGYEDMLMHDMLGLNPNFNPKFVRKYADLHAIILTAVRKYIIDITTKEFPNLKESF